MDNNSGPSAILQNKNSFKGKKKFKGDQTGHGRFKPYAGSRYEGQGFADLRKKRAAREYLKFINKEKKKDKATGKGANSKRPPLQIYDVLSRSHRHPSKDESHSFSKAQNIAVEKKKQKQEEREKMLQEKEAKETAMKAYKAKKKERFLKLCKKTKKGQPVMKNQMEVLLEKIMKHKGHDTDTKKAEG